MSKAYILVGVPGSGKSTWVSQQSFDLNKTIIASTDHHLEKYALNNNISYGEAFIQYIQEATDLMLDEVQKAFKQGLDLVWDQTSTTIKSRKKKIQMIPKSYEKIAVVFSIPEPEELKRRLRSRPGKVIPNRVMFQMINGFQIPTTGEGFDRIIHIN